MASMDSMRSGLQVVSSGCRLFSRAQMHSASASVLTVSEDSLEVVAGSCVTVIAMVARTEGMGIRRSCGVAMTMAVPQLLDRLQHGVGNIAAHLGDDANLWHSEDVLVALQAVLHQQLQLVENARHPPNSSER